MFGPVDEELELAVLGVRELRLVVLRDDLEDPEDIESSSTPAYSQSSHQHHTMTSLRTHVGAHSYCKCV